MKSANEFDGENPIFTIKSEHIKSLKMRLSQNEIKAARKVLNVFSHCFNEKKLKSGVAFAVESRALLKAIARAYFEDCARIFGQIPSSHKNYFLVSSYLKNIIAFFGALRSPAMLGFALRALPNALPLFHRKPRMLEALFKAVFERWSAGDAAFAAQCLLFARRALAGAAPDGRVRLLKLVFRQYEKAARGLCWLSYDALKLCRNCVKELARDDPGALYVVVFERLRKLSAALSDCMAKRDEKSVKALYGKQGMAIVALYSELAIAFEGDSLLGELVFPICECILAYANLYKKLEYYPFILHAFEQLTKLAENGKVRFSLCAGLLALLRPKRVGGRSPAARAKQFAFEVRAKATAAELGDESFWNDFNARVLFLIERQCAAVRSEPYFAAFAEGVAAALKARLKSRSSLETQKGVSRLVC